MAPLVSCSSSPPSSARSAGSPRSSPRHSWVDRLWSIVPVVYVWIFAGYAGFADARLDVMAVLVTLWGARLTFNFARKGGYTGRRGLPLGGPARPDEPGAVPALQPVLHRALPERDPRAHHASGIHGLREPGARSDRSTSCSPSLFLALLAGETIADQQQWKFHQWKKAERRGRPRSRSRGSCRPGCGASRGTPTSSSSRRSGGSSSSSRWPRGLGCSGRVAGAVLLTGCSSARRSSPRPSHAREVPGVRRLPGAHLRDRAVVPARARPQASAPPDRRAVGLRPAAIGAAGGTRQSRARRSGHDSANRGAAAARRPRRRPPSAARCSRGR